MQYAKITSIAITASTAKRVSQAATQFEYAKLDFLSN
jgi:hypothetical protein